MLERTKHNPNRGSSPNYIARRLAALVLIGAGSYVVVNRAVDVKETYLGNDHPALDHTYVVKPGDTPWTIAERVEPNADPRALVDEIVNQEENDVLAIGQKIKLPNQPKS